MKSMIKENNEIRKALIKRKGELSIPNVEICRDAKLRGIKIAAPTLSKYFNKSEDNNLSEASILYLCERYGIKVGLEVELLPYNETECLRAVKKKYPVIYGKKT